MDFGELLGLYQFSQFGGEADNSRTGLIFYRKRIISGSNNLQCLIPNTFDIPIFEITEMVVITYYRLIHMNDTVDSAVSHTTLYLLLIITSFKMHFFGTNYILII